jgi:predicted ATP-grasp superfamily ATP-dependent carboligase
MTLPHPSLLPLDGQLTALRDPIAIAAFWGWNDGAATATNAIRYLRKDWNAAEVARVDPDRFHDLSVARPRLRRVDGEPVLRWPGVRIHVASPQGADHDVITIAGREPALRWREFSEAVASVLEAVGARTLLLLGSRHALTPHTRPAPVGLSEGSEYFEQLLRLESSGRGGYQGPTGINTMLMLALRERGIDVARLTVRVPSYINAGPNPRAVLALVEVLDRAFGSVTRLGALSQQVEAFEQRMAKALAEAHNGTELKAQIAEMERQYDDARGDELPEPNELLGDLEQMLREHRDQNPDTPS